MLQTIITYFIVLMAVGYLVKKFLLPQSLFSINKGSKKACGQDDCGCN